MSQLWLDTTLDSWRTGYSFLNQSCSPTITLQLSCTLLSLIRHELRDQMLSIFAVRRRTLTESEFQACYSDCPISENHRRMAPPVAGRLTTLPRAVGVLARPATMCTPPRACLTCSPSHFSFLRLHRALRQASSRSAIAAPASPSPSSRTTAKTRRPARL